jgi:hypothetical protein
MPVTAYTTPEEAVKALRPGWKIVGRKPYEVEVDNPAHAAAPATTEAKIKQQQGTILSIEGPKGEPDTITVSNSQVLPADATGGGRGGTGITVIQGPTKGPVGNQASDPGNWTPVKRPGTEDVIGSWDPVNNEFHPIAAAPDAKPSGKYDNVYVTNADGSKRLVGMTDTGDRRFIPVAADPTTNKRTIQTPNALYSVDDNDNVKKLIDIDKTVPMQAVVIDGAVFSFDPNEQDPTKRLTSIQSAQPPAQIKQGDLTYIRKDQPDGTFTYELPPGVEKPAALQTNTTAKTLDWYDDKGNLIKSVPNKNYVEPKVDPANAPAANLTAPRILIPDPDHPGQLKWIDNEARVTASQALQSIASQLSGHVVDGKISVDEAKAIIDGANTSMATAAQAGAASLSAINQGATAGANLLNQRSQAAQNLVQQGQGLLSQTKHGLLVAPGGDFGQNLVQGAAGFATELGGGPEVFQAAANLVRRADPTGAQGQDAAAAYSTLTQMFQKYRQASGGEPHPAEVAALGGAGQQATQGAFAAPPQAAPAAPAAFTAPMLPPSMPAGPGNAPPNQVPGQNYGTGYNTAQLAGPRWPNPQPLPAGTEVPYSMVSNPSFVAPPQMPNLPAPSRQITISVPT